MHIKNERRHVWTCRTAVARQSKTSCKPVWDLFMPKYAVAEWHTCVNNFPRVGTWAEWQSQIREDAIAGLMHYPLHHHVTLSKTKHFATKSFHSTVTNFKQNDVIHKQTCSCALVLRCRASASARDRCSSCNEPLCHKLCSVAGDRCKCGNSSSNHGNKSCSTDLSSATQHALKLSNTTLCLKKQNSPWNLDHRLRCYEITTTSLVCFLLLEHGLVCKKIQQIWTFKFLEVVRQHILGVVGNVINHFVGNLIDFPAVKEFWKSVMIWRH